MTQPVHNPPEKPEQTPVELADFAIIASGDPAEILKQQAKRLRKALAARDVSISHLPGPISAMRCAAKSAVSPEPRLAVFTGSRFIWISLLMS